MTAEEWERVVHHLRVAALAYADSAENPQEKNQGVRKEFRKQESDAMRLADRLEGGER